MKVIKTEPYRVLAYFDFLAPTGFGMVTDNIIRRLVPFFKKNNIVMDICPLGIEPKQMFWYVPNLIRVLPVQAYAHNKQDVYFRDGFLRIVSEMEYDLVWIFNDISVIGPMLPVLEKIKKGFKKTNPDGTFTDMPAKKFETLFYTPVDSPVKAHQCKDLWKFEDLRTVTFTEYGKKQLEQTMDDEKNYPKIDIIGHAVENKFRPLHGFPANFNKEKYISDIRKKLAIPENAFVFGSVNGNHYRKDLAGLMRAFAHVKAAWADSVWQPKHQKPVLFLQTNPKATHGLNLFEVALTLGLEVGTDIIFGVPIVDTEEDIRRPNRVELEQLYHMMDMFVTTTTAEGWGLTVHEAVACEVPALYPAHTSIPEITGNLKDNPCMFPYSQEMFLGKDSENIRYISNPREVASRMLELARDIDQENMEKWQKPIQQVGAFARYISWGDLATRWERIFKHAVSRRRSARIIAK